VSKDDLKIDAYGTVDELNAFVGQARVSAIEAGLDSLAAVLLRVQHELFNLGSILATDPGKAHPAQPRVTADDVRQLETEIDAMNAELPKLRSFVLPGGCRLDAEIHIARTVCRRAERVLVALRRKEEVDDACLLYLNRLSDALFVWGRWACVKIGAAETIWEPNEAASGKRP
jgi:cob(I)alamin adenosyltransferase